MVIAGRSAYFLQAFVNIGLIPDAGATWLLPRLAGRARAMEMMMLGERVPAEKALEWGMISSVVEDEHLASESVALATRLAQGPTVALGLIRKLARDSQQLPLGEALAAERAAQRGAGLTEDFRSGVLAFLQKRQARFEGR
jgi:2-(1,2-epoxy-1,2-dihydrophenyl)acetyl-CoA isomerase